MTNEQNEKDTQDIQNKDAVVQPDPETLNTTDPQENMEGPISSLMQKTKETFEDNEPKEEGDDDNIKPAT